MPFDPESLPVPELGLHCFFCHYCLTGLMVHRCPECGRPFTMDEHIPPGDWPLVAVDGFTVLTTPEVMEVMRAAQIPILPQSDISKGLYGLSGTTPMPPLLYVARSAYWEAVDLLMRYARGESLSLGPPASTAEWSCRACGETNPGNFEVCWQCNGDRPNEI